MHTRQGVAEPAQTKDNLDARPNSSFNAQPCIFEWYENRIEEGLAKLYRVDCAQRQNILEIIRELNDSNLFWSLHSKWTDASAEAASDDDKQRALMAFLARLYIAGTLRGCQAVDL